MSPGARTTWRLKGHDARVLRTLPNRLVRSQNIGLAKAEHVPHTAQADVPSHQYRYSMSFAVPQVHSAILT